jgi:hypothetical protein
MMSKGWQKIRHGAVIKYASEPMSGVDQQSSSPSRALRLIDAPIAESESNHAANESAKAVLGLWEPGANTFNELGS